MSTQKEAPHRRHLPLLTRAGTQKEKEVNLQRVENLASPRREERVGNLERETSPPSQIVGATV